jgi:hypothetical protein
MALGRGEAEVAVMRCDVRARVGDSVDGKGAVRSRQGTVGMAQKDNVNGRCDGFEGGDLGRIKIRVPTCGPTIMGPTSVDSGMSSRARLRTTIEKNVAAVHLEEVAQRADLLDTVNGGEAAGENHIPTRHANASRRSGRDSHRIAPLSLSASGPGRSGDIHAPREEAAPAAISSSASRSRFISE